MPGQEPSAYERLSEIYGRNLPEFTDETDPTRSIILQGRTRLSVTQIASAAQQAFLVEVAGVSFYVSPEGLEWLSLPPLKVFLPYRHPMKGGHMATCH